MQPVRNPFERRLHLLFARQAIANASFRENVARLRRVGFDFSAKAGHGDAEVLRFFDVLLAPSSEPGHIHH